MAVRLKRRRQPGAAISVVSLIDVLMILLIFFMVTSTYLDLDMVPALATTSDPAAEGATPDPPAADPAGEGRAAVLLLHIDPDGRIGVQGRKLAPPAVVALLHERLETEPALQVALFPSPGASMQALVSAMDAAAAAGVRNLRLIRLEAEP